MAPGIALSLALGSVLTPNGVAGQVPPVLTIEQLHAGDCQIVLELKTAMPGDEVSIFVDQVVYPKQRVVAGTSRLTYDLGERLQDGSRVVAKVNDVAVAQVP